MKTVRIIGAGFSGLTLAYELSKRGVAVEIFEKTTAGGLIRSVHTQNGLAEAAANGFLATNEMLNLCRELGLKVLKPLPAARYRYIAYNGKLRRWPLGILESWRLGKAILTGRWRRPQSGETVATFINRVCGAAVLEKLVAPALQGIYGGGSEELSACLVLGVDPVRADWRVYGGMQTLTDGLVYKLKQHGVTIHQREIKSCAELQEDGVHVITAVSLKESLRLLGIDEPRLRMKGLISVTLWFTDNERLPRGFGTLFPRQESVTALGVLFNSDIFADRSEEGVRSETWIIDADRWTQLSDQELVLRLISERSRYFGVNQTPIAQKIYRWPEAMPHFDLNLEEFLKRRGPELRHRAHGNFMDSIGLAKIYSRSCEMAMELQ